MWRSTVSGRSAPTIAASGALHGPAAIRTRSAAIKPSVVDTFQTEPPAFDRHDAVAQVDLGAELAGALEQALRREHRIGVPRVALERRDRDPVEVERRPLRRHLLRFEEVGRDALVVQARHDLAHRRLVLGRVQHQQAGLAEPASRPVCCSKSRNIAIESPATRARNAFV